MKKILQISVLGFLSLANILAQEFKIIKTFPFNQPFPYYETWDPYEGRRPGVRVLTITSKDNYIIRETGSNLWRVYDAMNNEQAVIVPTFFGSFQCLTGKSMLGFGDLGSPESTFYIFDESLGLQKPTYLIKAPTELEGLNVINTQESPYLTGTTLFALTSGGDVVSWELLPNGRITYRNIDETKSWLAEGNAERLGYRKQGNRVFFGEFVMGNRPLLAWRDWKSYTLPEGEFASLSDLGTYIGSDSRGLNYYYFPYPMGSSIPSSMGGFPIVISIVDTWTKKVYFRKYTSGIWNPPRRANEGGSTELIGNYAWAVHPNGDIYFFDADLKSKEYQLKCLPNDWWREIDIANRKIARIKENYVPLQVTASRTGSKNGYNYEREFVWILEESTKTEIVAGKSIPWLKVRKLDGREGWILLSDVYFE